mmetsp:Transcript_22239/g.71935  ORF Transcript_22239/g.71935 Transcript_22239/m.71935 type:complete len:188 (+) Transcript_22239:102-665(+)
MAVGDEQAGVTLLVRSCPSFEDCDVPRITHVSKATTCGMHRAHAPPTRLARWRTGDSGGDAKEDFACGKETPAGGVSEAEGIGSMLSRVSAEPKRATFEGVPNPDGVHNSASPNRADAAAVKSSSSSSVAATSGTSRRTGSGDGASDGVRSPPLLQPTPRSEEATRCIGDASDGVQSPSMASASNKS